MRSEGLGESRVERRCSEVLPVDIKDAPDRLEARLGMLVVAVVCIVYIGEG
jgi:hypothetical protein